MSRLNTCLAEYGKSWLEHDPALDAIDQIFLENHIFWWRAPIEAGSGDRLEAKAIAPRSHLWKKS